MKRAALFAGLFFLSVPGGALAHATLASSQPADGSVLTEAPTTVSLTFGGDVRLVSLLLKNAESADIPLLAEPPHDARRNISASLPKLSPGGYSVEWRAAAKDMHAMSGVIQFTVAAPSVPDR
ncbi:MAG: copper resistance protein CopC [Rhodospirillales bacterium]|nr:copper resistance protein CopC [Rhodospirillales bacterium]